MYLKKILPALSSTAVPVVYPWYRSGGVAAANCLAAWVGIGAASAAAANTNLANPGTYDLVADLVPWSAEVGWSPAVNKRIHTYIIPQASYTLIARFDSITPANFTALMGPDNLFTVGYVNSWYVALGNSKSSTSQATSGVFAIHDRKLYLNGTAITDQCSTSTPTQEIFFLKAGLSLPCTFQAAAVYDSITEAQMQAVSTAMAAL